MDRKRIKLSGSQYRKNSKIKQDEQEKLLKKILTITSMFKKNGTRIISHFVPISLNE